MSAKMSGATAASPRRRRGLGRGGRRAIRIAAAVLVAVLWFKATRLAILALDLNAKAKALKAQALALPHSKDIPGSIHQLRSGVDDIHAEIQDVRVTLWPFEGVLKAMDGLPAIGHSAAALPYLLEIADSTLGAAHDLAGAYGPLAEKILSGTKGSDSALDTLTQATQVDPQALADARRNVDVALAARRQIADASTLHPKLQELLADVDRALGPLNEGIAAAQAAPDLLGVSQPQHVLVLIENADELRATGGFITASAYIVIDKGHLGTPVVVSSNSSQLDRDDKFQYEVPPPPFYKYMHLQNWYFRDANWWSDYPTSANKAAELYSAGMGVPVDTVVAINQYTIRDLIGIAGEITLSDGTVITRDNTITAIQDLWTQNLAENGEQGRKDFIKSLAPLLMAKLTASRDPQMLLRAWDAQQAMSQRHDLLMYSTNPQIQALAERMGLDGAIPSGKGDFLYIPDTNVGWNKVDLVMERTMSYVVNLSYPAQPSAEVKLVYHNPSKGQFGGPACMSPMPAPPMYPGRADDCYADFLRLYVPAGTQLVSSPTFKYPDGYVGQPDEDASHFITMPGEQDKQVYGALMVIPVGRQRILNFSYTLKPQTIFETSADGRLVYHLTIRKQPGRRPFPVKVEIELPHGVGVSRITPAPSSQVGDTLTFELTANQDLNIEVIWSGGASLIQQLGIGPGNEDAAQTPRAVPSNPPLPTALPVTPTVTPTRKPKPTATPTAATPSPMP